MSLSTDRHTLTLPTNSLIGKKYPRVISTVLVLWLIDLKLNATGAGERLYKALLWLSETPCFSERCL